MADSAVETNSADGTTLADDYVRDPKVEAKAEKAITEAADATVAMKHPDGGTSDAYKTDKAGNLLVPASDVAAMADHGFAIVDA